jgi:hypothetical protein
MTDLSRTPKAIQAILVPKVKEPWLKRPLDVTLSSLMHVPCEGVIAGRHAKRGADSFQIGIYLIQ